LSARRKDMAGCPAGWLAGCCSAQLNGGRQARSLPGRAGLAWVRVPTAPRMSRGAISAR
jgi:hypothetical protein